MYHTPIGQLVVPNQGMASQHLSVRLGEIHNRIALVEGESALRRLGRAPLYIALAHATQAARANGSNLH